MMRVGSQRLGIHSCNNLHDMSKNCVLIWMIPLPLGLFYFSIRNDIRALKSLKILSKNNKSESGNLRSEFISQLQFWISSISIASILFNWTFWKIFLKICVGWCPIRTSENKPNAIINRLFELKKTYELDQLNLDGQLKSLATVMLVTLWWWKIYVVS